jgi:flagellar basal-body rod protein FlgB
MIPPIAPFAEQMLNLAAKRQQAIAANIANADTPGYRATDFTFEQELEGIQLEGTNPSHLAPGSDDANVRKFEVNSTVKQNGNDVDLERELTELSKNGIQYVALVQFITQKIRTLRSSLNEGGR